MFQYCFSTIVIVHTAKNEGEKEEIFFASSLFCNFRGDTPKKLIFNSACGKKKYATHFFFLSLIFLRPKNISARKISLEIAD